MGKYVSKAIINKIQATSRASIKVLHNGKDEFYTLEYSEERIVPDIEGVDIQQERKLLWDAVNGEVDQQIADTIAAVKSANAASNNKKTY